MLSYVHLKFLDIMTKSFVKNIKSSWDDDVIYFCDVIIKLLSLHQNTFDSTFIKIQYSPNSLLEKAFSLIRDCQFDSLRVWVAQMLGIQLSNSSYNLLGYEGRIVQLLFKKFSLCSDSYKIVFQCWGCCYESENIFNLTSLTTFNSNLQSSINNKIDSSFNCLKCRDPCANIEPRLFEFTELLPLLIMEVGHLNEVVRVQDISDSVSIVHKIKCCITHSSASRSMLGYIFA